VWEEISGGAEIIELGDASMNSRAYCGAFNFKGGDQQKKVGLLSGGERNRVHMAKLLKSGGNVLLLDEPTNDLDVETLRALEDALEDFAGCAVIISHDRFFLDRLCTHILAFEGEAHVEWFEGNFEDYEEDKKRSGLFRTPDAGRTETMTRVVQATNPDWSRSGPVKSLQEVRAKNPCDNDQFTPYPSCDRYRTRYPVSSTRTSASICYTDATPPQSRGRTPD
jgi:ABC-type multidrug transport system ATPase subunit